MVNFLLKLWDLVTLRALVVPDVYSGACRCDLAVPPTYPCDSPKCNRGSDHGKAFWDTVASSGVTPEPPPLPPRPEVITVCTCFRENCKHSGDPNYWRNRLGRPT